MRAVSYRPGLRLLSIFITDSKKSQPRLGALGPQRDSTRSSHQNTAQPKPRWGRGAVYWNYRGFRAHQHRYKSEVSANNYPLHYPYCFLWTKGSRISKSHVSWLSSVLTERAHKEQPSSNVPSPQPHRGHR